MERTRTSSVRRRTERTLAYRCRELCRSFIAFMFSNVGIIGLVVGYTVAGAFIFQTIERTYHVHLMKNVTEIRSRTVEHFWNYTLIRNPFDPKNEVDDKKVLMEDLIRYQMEIVNAIRNGYDGLDADSYKDKWNFERSFLYSLTVITTIGYGNLSPHTINGKLATIIYAIIGMPLFLLYLSNIGDIMARSFKWIYANCCLCRWCPSVAKRRLERQKRRAQNVQNIEDDASNHPDSISSENTYSNGQSEEEDGSFDVQTVTVPVTICLAIMVGYICGGALVFRHWENWELLDASYFCFISLSTIGFGDIVPGNIYGSNTDGKYFESRSIFCSMYLMLGMALIAMCFNLMQILCANTCFSAYLTRPSWVRTRLSYPASLARKLAYRFASRREYLSTPLV